MYTIYELASFCDKWINKFYTHPLTSTPPWGNKITHNSKLLNGKWYSRRTNGVGFVFDRNQQKWFQRTIYVNNVRLTSFVAENVCILLIDNLFCKRVNKSGNMEYLSANVVVFSLPYPILFLKVGQNEIFLNGLWYRCWTNSIFFALTKIVL